MQKYFRFKALGPYIGNISKSTVIRWVAAGRFPPPMRVGENVSAWSEEQLEAWQRGIVGTAEGTAVSKQKSATRKKKSRSELEAA
ncbi:MAG: helix-turn-helix transcriptional regulator [Casimicrobiaceae bacterium]